MEEIKIYSSELDKIFLSYDKILFRLKSEKTKTGKEITHTTLRKAINTMETKHKKCRWKSEKIKSKNSYILIEGYYWLKYVYFNNEKNLLDADIEFFEERIELYEKLLKLTPRILFNKDISVEELSTYFSRKKETIKKAVLKMIKVHNEYRYKINKKYIVTQRGVEWLAKNCFKNKYLELLEEYKMELTEKYIQAGYIYDNFFGKN